MLCHIQDCALASDIHRGVSKPHCSLGFVLRVFVWLKDEPSSQSQVHSALEQVIVKEVSVHCCTDLPLNPV